MKLKPQKTSHEKLLAVESQKYLNPAPWVIATPDGFGDWSRANEKHLILNN